MNIIPVVFLGVSGLAVGSFVNLAVDRLPAGQSLAKPRSHCPVCQEPVSSLDLVPVFNYLWLRGHCRYCRAPIPPRSPVIELIGGLLFAYVGYRWGYTLDAALAAFAVIVLMLTFFIDLERQIILDKVTFPALAIVLVAAPFGPAGEGASLLWSYVQALAGVGVGFGALLAIYLVSWRLNGQPGIGEGDVKFGALMGAILGWRLAIVALPVGFILGGVFAFGLILFWGKGRRDVMPYGTFLNIGTLITYFFGIPIRDWYLRLLGV
ncbi:MAG: prepilin peptidase [Dehalococcoidia bacterium]|nr:prepilin peptidase [Dehalococcoidia bacterium]